MRKLWILLAAAIVLAMYNLIPFQATDVAQLQPVQTLVVSQTDDVVSVNCGENLIGRGKTLKNALKDLQRSAPGTVFFGTAQKIVVCGPATLWAQVASVKELRPGAQLYDAASAPEAEDVTEFLYAHQTQTTLLDLRAALLYDEPLSVPVLQQNQGRYSIVSAKQI